VARRRALEDLELTADALHWRDRNVFVTGCTGLLGSWVTQTLAEAGANVVGLVRDHVPRSRLVRERVIDRITTVSGAVEDVLLVERALGEYEIDTVFHLAAQTIVGIANRNPLSTFDANVRGTWSVLEACRRSALVKSVVVASSDKAYGAQPTLPYDETMPLSGAHPYDVSKSCTDLIAASYFHTYRLPVAITRFGNFYGGGDLNFNRLIPQTIRHVLRDEAPVIRSDGTFVRDYIYIEDAAAAYVLLAERLREDGSLAGEAFNFSCEQPVTVVDLVDRILRLMGRADLRPRVMNEASNEIHAQYLAAGKARARLGWKPKHTLDEGLERTIAWYRAFFAQGGRQ
jgi:CDP-glucose 4,6-dehydratase